MSVNNSILFLLLFANPIGTADPGGPRRPDQHVVASLEEGDTAPDFEGVDDRSRPWKSTNVIGKRTVVVFFYPADFKSGCTLQAAGLQRSLNELEELDVDVIGISGDSPSNHALFKRVHKLKFRLLADETGALAAQFGVPQRRGGQRVLARGPDRQPIVDQFGKKVFLTRDVTLARRTFIIGRNGKIVYKNTRVCPRSECKQIVRFLRSLPSD